MRWIFLHCLLILNSKGKSIHYAKNKSHQLEQTLSDSTWHFHICSTARCLWWIPVLMNGNPQPLLQARQCSEILGDAAHCSNLVQAHIPWICQFFKHINVLSTSSSVFLPCLIRTAFFLSCLSSLHTSLLKNSSWKTNLE